MRRHLIATFSAVSVLVCPFMWAPAFAADAQAPTHARQMVVRGIRGATTVDANTPEAIHAGTKALLTEMLQRNAVPVDAIVTVFFTSTPDLDAAFPAAVARQIAGFDKVPLMGGLEVAVPTGLKKCVRILLQFNTTKGLADIEPVYMGEAVKLRPDLIRK